MTFRPQSASQNAWRSDLDGITLALRQQLFDKGMTNVATLRKIFRMEDWTGDGCLNRDEFEHAMHKCGIFLTASEISTVMRCWDRTGDGRIDYEEWLNSLRGSLNHRRDRMVDLVYEALKERALPCNGGKVTFKFVQSEFRVKCHPRVSTGLMEEEECLRQLVDGLQECMGKNAVSDPVVSVEAFKEFYGNLSGGMPSDDYFVYMLEQVWNQFEDEQKRFDDFLDSIERLFVIKAKEVAKGNEIEEKAMARIFKFFDIDGSGDLDKEEFAMAMERFGMTLTKKEIDGFFRRYDEDGGGEISFEELVGRVCSSGAGPTGGGVTGLAPPWDANTVLDAQERERAKQARLAAGQY